MKKSNKIHKPAVTALAFFIMISFALLPGCKKEEKPPPPTPTPTNTPVPKIERIAYAYNGNLYWMETDGKGRRVIFSGEGSKWYPSASPDGWYIMFWMQTMKSYNLWLGSLKTRSYHQVTFDRDSLEGEIQNFKINNAVAWSQDSSYVVYSRNKDIWKMTREGFNQAALTDSHDCISPSLSKDGKLVYARIEGPRTHNLYIKSIDEKEGTKLTDFQGKKAGSPRFSPNGRKIVFTLSDSENVDVWIIDVNTKKREPLTFDGKSHSPCFSYSGDKIIFSGSVHNKYQPDIWIMNIDKTNRRKLTENGGVSPSWLRRILKQKPTPTPEIEKKQPAEPAREEYKAEEVPVETTTPLPAETVEVYEDLAITVVKQGDELLFYPVIHFDSAYANIKQEYYGVLDDMMKIIKRYESPIIISGHTDNVPISTERFPSNYELSVARAQAVKDYLVSKHGVDPGRISVEGYNADRPIVPNNSPENRYKNRRAEVYLKIIKAEQAKAEAETGEAPEKVPEEPEAAPTPEIKPTPKPTYTPTPEPNFFEKILNKFKKPKKEKKGKGAAW